MTAITYQQNTKRKINMAIISRQESFLLKFTQESSQVDISPIDVSVTRDSDKYLVEFRGDKKTAIVKVDLESLREILGYIDSKIYGHAPAPIKTAGRTTAPVNSNYTLTSPQAGINGPSNIEANIGVKGTSVGSISDLVKDMSFAPSSGSYNSQADIIMSHGVDILSIEQ